MADLFDILSIWNGHASFTITAADGTAVVTDPYDPKAFGGVFDYDMVIDRADGVLVSHDHADHNHYIGHFASLGKQSVDNAKICISGNF